MSYYGSVSHHLDPAYGATKAGLDKMTWDMAQDFREQGVAVICVWPGPTGTGRSMAPSPQLGDGQDRTNTSETPAFTGRVVAALYETPTSSGAPTKSSSEPRPRSSTDSAT
jgi:NAD(P)-dependent dehydrogenase (short-subunit alcohol dehydrogenase family)